MIVTLELSTEMEARLRAGIARHDAESVRQVLHDAVEPTIEALLERQDDSLSAAAVEQILDRLADEAAVLTGTDRALLSDYATSRAGIYADHP